MDKAVMDRTMELSPADAHGNHQSTFAEKPETVDYDIQMGGGLKRRFNFGALVAFASRVLVTWEVIPVVVLTTLVKAPTSGGQYHWTFMLAPEAFKVSMIYVMGWLILCGWPALVASTAYLCGNLILAVVTLVDPGDSWTDWQSTLIYWAIMFLAIMVNWFGSAWMIRFEHFVLTLQVVGFFAVLIPLVVVSFFRGSIHVEQSALTTSKMCPEKATSTAVWTQFNNGGNWPSLGVSIMVGMIGPVFANNGTDCAVHMAEETERAEINVPRCIVFTSIVNGLSGLSMLLAILYVTPNVDAILESPTGELGFPFMQVFLDSVGSRGGAAVMISIIIAMLIFAVIAFLATASRIVYAFGRDKGLPFSRFAAKLDDDTAIPTIALLALTVSAVIVGCINFASATVFQCILSIGISSLYGSYTLVASILLWRRLRGDIRKPSQMAGDDPGAHQFVWGPFRIPGVLGCLNNIWAVCYGAVVIIFYYFPATTNPDAAHMNWACLITPVIMIFAAVYYFLHTRKDYKGPTDVPVRVLQKLESTL